MTSEIISDRYQVRQQLGKKAGRRTVLAYDLKTHKLVVVKILKFSPDFEWQDLKLFEREAQILQNLSHQSIPDYLDYFELNSPQNQGFALVQTYLEAKSLEQHRVAGLTFTETEIKQLAKSLLEILIYLHQRQPAILHRDIKPSNILLANRSGNHVGQVYLVDFGSVQNFAATEGGTFTIVGTYGYMPPEQFGGRAVPASDLYSLGATLVYLVTGKHPADLPQQNLRLQFREFTSLSPGFSHWLEQMIEPSLEQRFSSAKNSLEALENQKKITNFALKKNKFFKPTNSQVECYQYGNRIEIQYPQFPSSIFYFFGLSFFLFCYWVLLKILSYILPSSWLIFLFTLSSIILLIKVIIHSKIFLSDHYKIICIDCNNTLRVGSCYEMKNRIVWDYKYCFETISLLAYHPGYTFNEYFDETGKKVKTGRVKIDTKLSIYMDNKEYSIASPRLSSADLWWIGQELSDFLNLELQIIYTTPKVPPKPSCGGGC